MVKKLISVLLCLVLVVSLAPIAANADTTISKVDLTLDFPEAGKTPAYTATWNSSGYSVYTIDWRDLNEDRFLETDEKIQANHPYEAQIWVMAEDGYDFNCINDNTPAITAIVNGQECEVSKAFEYKAWAMVVVHCYFSYVPEKGWIKSVDLTIPAPVVGQLPFYGPVATDTYSLSNVYFSGNTDPNMKNGINWTNKDTNTALSPSAGEVFAPNSIYTFHCLVLPAEGYRMTASTVVRVNGKVARARLDYDHFLAVFYDFPATKADAHTHTPSDWRITQVYHYTVCTDCGEMLVDEDHKGGEATCREKAICTVCGAPYGFLADHELITDSWTYLNDQGHAHGCQSPGCDYHGALYPHVPGPPATVSSPQLCSECGYVLQASENHTHSLTKVPAQDATCMDTGVKEHYTCSGCPDLFADSQGREKITDKASLSIGALGHTVSDQWVFDAAYHWRSCTACAATLEETAMLHEDTDSDGRCDTCGYAAGQEPTEAPQTQPPATDPVPIEKAPSGEQNAASEPGSFWIPVVVAVVIGIACGILLPILIVKAKKKKE